MRKRVVWILAVVVVAATAYVLVGRGRGARMENARSPVLPAVKAGNQVVAEARVVPIRGATLSLPTGGVVAEITVNEGDRVQTGQVLVRLEAAKQAAASVAQADAQVRRARARLNELRAGARAQDIEAAKAALTGAQARLDQLRAGARPQERAQAGSQVEQAEQQAASAQQRILQAEAALRLAQDDLRRAEQLFSQKAVPQQFVDQAKAKVTTAQADLDAARAQSAAAQAAVASARQQQSLVQTGARDEEIRAADAEVQRARAQLDLLMAGTRPETIAAAEADVAAAAASLKQAAATMDQAELRSPLDGVVAWVGPKVGEYVAPGAPVARVGNLSIWRVETTDLTELGIVAVKVGSPVRVTFDAIPGLELTGRVTQIKAFGENKLGDIVYTVTIALDKQDERLRWNMTASVAVESK